MGLAHSAVRELIVSVSMVTVGSPPSSAAVTSPESLRSCPPVTSPESLRSCPPVTSPESLRSCPPVTSPESLRSCPPVTVFSTSIRMGQEMKSEYFLTSSLIFHGAV